MVIRQATRDDEDDVVALWTACDLLVPYNDPHVDFRIAVAGPASTVLVGADAERDGGGGLIASVMAGFDGHRGWLYFLAVHPDEQGRGTGRKMIEAAEEWLRRQGVAKVQLLIRQENAAKVAFYQHMHYEETPRIVMAKWL